MGANRAADMLVKRERKGLTIFSSSLLKKCDFMKFIFLEISKNFKIRLPLILISLRSLLHW